MRLAQQLSLSPLSGLANELSDESGPAYQDTLCHMALLRATAISAVISGNR